MSDPSDASNVFADNARIEFSGHRPGNENYCDDGSEPYANMTLDSTKIASLLKI